MTIKELLESLGYVLIKESNIRGRPDTLRNPLGKKVRLHRSIPLNEDINTNNYTLIILKSGGVLIVSNSKLLNSISGSQYFTNLYSKGVDILKGRTQKEVITYLKYVGEIK